MIPILFTTYNRLEYTKQALAALRKHTKIPHKLYVVDNCSTDGTRKWLQEQKWGPDDELLLRHENHGIADTMNTFFAKFQDAEWVAKVDNDTIVPKNWLGKLLKAAVDFDLDVVGAKHHFNVPAYKGGWEEVASRNRCLDSPDGRIILHPWVGGSGILIRRCFLEEIVPGAMGHMSGWTEYQAHKGRKDRIAFHCGVKLKLLDMKAPNEFNNDYPEYNAQIYGSRIKAQRVKPKITFILVECDGIDWYRAQQVGNNMSRTGLAEVRFVRQKGHPLELTEHCDWADLIVWRWPTFNMMELRLEMAKEWSHPKAFVVDFEDNFFEVSPFNESYRYFGTREVNIIYGGKPVACWQNGANNFNIDRNIRTVRLMHRNLLHSADITVSSETMGEAFAEHGLDRYWVVPDTVDPQFFPRLPLKHHKGVRIGWSGGASHFEDIYAFTPLMRRVMEKYPQVTFVVYGSMFEGPMSILPPDRVEFHGWQNIHAHGFKLATLDLDIAVIPLVESRFTQAKSSLKWKEYSVLGLPTVAQNWGPYARDIEHGRTGLLVSNDDEWETALGELITGPKRRKELGEAAHEEILKNHTAQKWGLKCWQIYTEIMEKQGIKPTAVKT